MSIILFIAGLALVAYGASVRIDSVMHQIYASIYIVGGIVVIGIGAVAFHLARMREDGRRQLKVEKPEVSASLEAKAAADSRTTFIALALLAGLCAIIAYKWSHAGP